MMVQVSTYDAAGRPSREVLANELLAALPPLSLHDPFDHETDRTCLSRQTLSDSLRAVHNSAVALESSPPVPDTLVNYVENGRNPDVYTREFVERVHHMNQLSRGKMHAFESFRDILAAQMDTAMPELQADVRRVVESTSRAAVPNGSAATTAAAASSAVAAAGGAATNSGPGAGVGNSSAPGGA